MPRRPLPTALLATLAVLLAAPAAHAASLSLVVSPDPAEDRATTIVASGVADTGAEVRVKIRRAGGAPCAPTASQENGADVVGGDGAAAVAAGAFSVPRTRTIATPGDYLLCGYLIDSDGPDAATSRAFSVRSNLAALTAAEVPHEKASGRLPVVLRGATEIRRRVYATVKRGGGAGCGTSLKTDTGRTRVVDGASVEGAFSVKRTRSYSRGTYLLCAWVQEGAGDLSPEARISAAFTVGGKDSDGDGVGDSRDRCPTVTGTPPRGCILEPAKLEVARLEVRREARALSVLAPITARASGSVTVDFRADGRTRRFTVPVDARERRVRFLGEISRAQAALGTGIATITYRGDADTQPQQVRLRAARHHADLEAQRPVIAGGRLQAQGTVSSRARGVVRLQLVFAPAGQRVRTVEYKTPIEDGSYTFDVALPADVQAGIASRRGVVHSYTLFTGDLEKRVRGEMEAFQVLPAQ